MASNKPHNSKLKGLCEKSAAPPPKDSGIG